MTISTVAFDSEAAFSIEKVVMLDGLDSTIFDKAGRSMPKFAGVPAAFVGVAPPMQYLIVSVSTETNMLLAGVNGASCWPEAATQ